MGDQQLRVVARRAYGFHFARCAHLDAVLEQVHSGTIPAKPGGIFDKVTRRLNAASGTAFIIGAALGGFFMISNVGGCQISDQQQPRPANSEWEQRGQVVPAPSAKITTPKGSTYGTASGTDDDPNFRETRLVRACPTRARAPQGTAGEIGGWVTPQLARDLHIVTGQ